MEITITKKLAKQGDNAVLIIPKNLQPFLQAGDLVKVSINKLLKPEDQTTQIIGPTSMLSASMLLLPRNEENRNGENQDHE